MREKRKTTAISDNIKCTTLVHYHILSFRSAKMINFHSCLTSIKNIFSHTYDAADFSKTKFELRALAGSKSDLFSFIKGNT